MRCYLPIEDHVEKVFNILKEYGEDLWPYLSEFKQDREVYLKLRDRFQLLYKEVVLDRLSLITEPVSQKRGVIQTITDLFLKLFSRRDPTSQRIATLERVIKGMLIPEPTKRFTIQQVKDSLLACS